MSHLYKKFTVRFPEKLNQRLIEHARDQDRSKNAQLVNILKQYFKELDEKKQKNKNET